MEHKFIDTGMETKYPVLRVEECIFCDTTKTVYVHDTGPNEDDFEILYYLMTGRTQHADRGCPTKLKPNEL